MNSVSIIIINFNGAKYLPRCLQSVERQSYAEREIIFIDNASSDNSVENAKKTLQIATKNKSVPILLNEKNLGYSAAANQGIRQAKGDYVMIMNPDVILETDYIQNILDYAKKHPEAGAMTGKLLKYDFDKHQKTNIIDSTGLYCYRNRRIIDRGQGLEDEGQFEKTEEVFGISGACPIYQKEALEKIKIKSEYFDEDFFMYKEDIDVSWRFRLAGYTCVYVPHAIAYHARGTGVLKRFTHWEVAKNRRHLNRFQKELAFKNQRLMQIKNEMLKNVAHDFPQILWKEILIAGYILFREPYLLKAVWKLMLQIPKAVKKRKIIMVRKRINAKDMQQWFGGKSVISNRKISTVDRSRSEVRP